MRYVAHHFGLWALFLSPAFTAAQERPADYRTVASRFADRVIAAGPVTIERMDLGRMALDTNRITALVTNRDNSPRFLGLSLRAVPGLWVRANWQRGYRFEIPARSQRLIEAAYVFRRMTPEATLQVVFGTPRGIEHGIEIVEPFYDITLAVGTRNPAASEPRLAFDTLSTEHFDLFAWRGSAGARQLPAIAAGRELALRRVSEILAVPFTGRILLVLYPDSATKTAQTGHIGAGFADGRTIVEIFNDSVQLDPYHEVAHIVAGARGSPPALLDEGFAVHVSESLGADALRYLGAPGQTVAQVVCGYRRSGRLLPLSRLFRFSDIGSDSTVPGIAYPEASSIVAFLIERYGIERFRDVYARLRNSTDPAELLRNEQILQETYGSGIAAIDLAWRAWLPCPALDGSGSPPLTASQAPEEVPFVLTRLALDLHIDYGRRTIGGTATLQLRNASDRPGVGVPLLLGRLMAVSRVVDAAGADIPVQQHIAVFRDDSSRQVNAVVAIPGRPVAPGDSLTIVVHYGGILVGYTETGSLYIQDRVSRDFTIIREDAYAFPMLGVPSWRSNRAAPREPFAFAARVSVPVGLVVAMAGELRERTQQDSVVTWSYGGTEPVPFLNIAIASYRLLERAGVRIFYLPTDSTGAPIVERAVAEAVLRYRRWYGPLGREPQLLIIEIPEGFGSQASLTAGILQTADAFRDRSERRQLYHELSHLWNVPDLERPSPRWNEGLASFLQWRMAAELDGWNQWDAQLERTAQSLMRRCVQPVRCDSVAPAGYGGAGLTDLAYPVGMLMFYALYQVLGPEPFDRAYRGFFQQYRETGATSAELVAAFHRVSRRSDRVFTDWLLTTRWYARLASGESFRRIVEAYRQQ